MEESILLNLVLKEIEKIKEKIKNKKILLQLPDGLKYSALKIIDALRDIGCEVIFSGEPCYGACDIRDYEANLLGCDIILHIGHKKFYKKIETKVPVIYIPIDLKIEYDKNELRNIKEKRVGIISTVQHIKMIKNVAKDLEKIGKKVVIGGDILGCNIEKAKKINEDIDCFLFVGSGKFHAISLLKLKKPVYILDLERNKVYRLEDDLKFERKLILKFEKFEKANTIGILLSSKPGQFYRNYKFLNEIKEGVEKQGKKVYIIIFDRITQENLEGLKIDFFINTACPRICEDYFKRPIINIDEFLFLSSREKYKSV
ncbi:MAG: diphthamide biosynthesis enzyme Dph2 [Candidatus Aenigmatarchaeota archaeon]